MSADLELAANVPGVLMRTAGLPDLEAWAAQMTFAGTIARGLAGTPFVPKSLRVYYRPDNSNRDEIDIPATTASVAAALLTGTEVGLEPMAALRSIDIIDGTPALRAMALRALVLRAGHDVWVVETTQTRAIVSGVRAGSTHEQTSVWTWDRAKAAQLTGKPNWTRHPGAMLIARATGEVARLIAPDVLLGLPYASEELADGDIAEQPEPVTAPPPARRTAQRRRRAQLAAPDPDAEDNPPTADEDPVEDDPDTDGIPENIPAPEPEPVPELPAPPPDGITRGQIAALTASFNRGGMSSQTDRLAVVTAIVGREITDIRHLHRMEAMTVLDQLEIDYQAAHQEDDPS